MKEIRFRLEWCLVLVVASLLVGCYYESLPPSGNSIGGRVEEVVYSYHYWEEGLAVLLWYDLADGEESCQGAVVEDGALYREMCSVSALDGRHFAWELHTVDGVTADVWIELQPFDLSKGQVFLIDSQSEGFKVTQLELELSQFVRAPEHDAILALAEEVTAVWTFINRD